MNANAKRVLMWVIIVVVVIAMALVVVSTVEFSSCSGCTGNSDKSVASPSPSTTTDPSSPYPAWCTAINDELQQDKDAGNDFNFTRPLYTKGMKAKEVRQNHLEYLKVDAPSVAVFVVFIGRDYDIVRQIIPEEVYKGAKNDNDVVNNLIAAYMQDENLFITHSNAVISFLSSAKVKLVEVKYENQAFVLPRRMSPSGYPVVVFCKSDKTSGLCLKYYWETKKGIDPLFVSVECGNLVNVTDVPVQPQPPNPKPTSEPTATPTPGTPKPSQPTPTPTARPTNTPAPTTPTPTLTPTATPTAHPTKDPTDGTDPTGQPIGNNPSDGPGDYYPTHSPDPTPAPTPTPTPTPAPTADPPPVVVQPTGGPSETMPPTPGNPIPAPGD